MVLSGSMPIMMAASPNCRSRSSSSVRRSCRRANIAARFAGQHGLAGSALGREQADDLAFDAGRCLTGASPARPAASENAFLMVKTMPSVSCGSSTTSKMPADRASPRMAVGAGRRDQDDRGGGDRPDRLDLGRRHVIGGAGAVQDHLSGGLGQLGAGLGRICCRSHQLDVGVIGEALTNLGEPVGGAGDEHLDRRDGAHYSATHRPDRLGELLGRSDRRRSGCRRWSGWSGHPGHRWPAAGRTTLPSHGVQRCNLVCGTTMIAAPSDRRRGYRWPWAPRHAAGTAPES